MKNKTAILIFLILALVVAAYFIYTENEELFMGEGRTTMDEIQDEVPVVNEPTPASEQEFTFPLTDVTDGAYIDSINTNGEALGMLQVSVSMERTMLRAVFENLPVLGDDYFYEGWLVDTSEEGEFISTGEALLDSRGNHVNDFVSTDDLSAYDQYVLTLEPNDGNPAPADHLLEGVIDWQRADGTAEESMESDDAMSNDSMEQTAGIYTNYDPTLLANAENGDVVLFFKADWCPTCNAFDNDVRENITEMPEDLTLLKIDYDTSDDLKEKYGITYQHTYVQVDAQGNEIKKWVGSLTLEQFLAEVI